MVLNTETLQKPITTKDYSFSQPIPKQLISLLKNFCYISLNNLNKTDSQNHPSKMDIL